MAVIIAFSLDDLIALYVSKGDMSLLDPLIYHFTSNLSIYLYPYIWLFLQLNYLPFRENLMSVLIRYGSRDKFLRDYYKWLLVKIGKFFLILLALIYLSAYRMIDFANVRFSGFINSYLSQELAVKYPSSNYILYGLSFLLSYFLFIIFISNLFILLTNFDKKPFESFSIIAGILLFSGILSIGYLGEGLRTLSVYHIFSPFGLGGHILLKLLLMLAINLIVAFISKEVFMKKEIVLIKTNKTYKSY